MSAIRNSPSTDQAVTRPVRIASACFYLAAVVALTGVLGVVLGSVPDIQDRLGWTRMPTGTTAFKPASFSPPWDCPSESS